MAQLVGKADASSVIAGRRLAIGQTDRGATRCAASAPIAPAQSVRSTTEAVEQRVAPEGS